MNATKPNQEPQPKHWGVARSGLSKDLISGVLDLYYRAGTAEDYTKPYFDDEVEAIWRNYDEQLAYSNVAEYRLGSRFTFHSKFLLVKESGGVIRFSIAPNIDSRIEKSDGVDAMIEDFEARTAAYLKQSGIAVPIF